MLTHATCCSLVLQAQPYYEVDAAGDTDHEIDEVLSTASAEDQDSMQEVQQQISATDRDRTGVGSKWSDVY